VLDIGLHAVLLVSDHEGLPPGHELEQPPGARRRASACARVLRRVHKRGAYIKVLDRPGLDLTTPSGRGILALLSGLAEEERTRILRRANEGRIAAIKRGTKLGRNPKLSEHQQQEARKRLKAGESYRAIAKSYQVHHATIGRLAG
jgi:DNA invertase Pin-like site-specific DNA recombinase